MLVAAPQTFAQKKSGEEDTRGPRLETERPHWYSGVTEPYRPRVVPPVSVSNSNRIDALLRAGNLYVSLSDAIALALENNLDIEIERYEFSMAEADLLRARAGAAILGIPTTVLGGIPTGAGALLGRGSSGIAAAGAAGPLGTGLSFDPAITGTLNLGGQFRRLPEFRDGWNSGAGLQQHRSGAEFIPLYDQSLHHLGLGSDVYPAIAARVRAGSEQSHHPDREE